MIDKGSKTTKIKICGITSTDQAEMVCKFDIDAIGIVLYKNSKRYVRLEESHEIMDSVSKKISTVALMVNPAQNEVEKVIEMLKPDFVQFHGDESSYFCNQFKYPFIKAIRVHSELNLITSIQDFKAEGGFLFDAWHPTKYGGTGETFDWNLLPKKLSAPLILAGGLNSDNVGKAIEEHKPYMVDVSGGVENSPGLKDECMLADFVESVKLADISAYA